MYAKRAIGPILSLGYFLLFTYLFQQGYLLADATFWIGICLIPYVLISSELQKRTWRSGVILFMVFIICIFARATSLRYLLAVISFVFMIETLHGKIDSLLIWLLLIISPLFRYATEVFTFPIRLHLSEWAGSVLRAAGFSVTISGNIIQMNGIDFAVDPACMGLQMMGFSFLAGVFLIAHYQRETKKRIGSTVIMATMIFIFLLNLVTNLFRIILLVVFSITPDNSMHDFAGLFSLLIYVLIPASILVKYLLQHLGKRHAADSRTDQHAVLALAANIVALILCSFFVLQSRQLNIRKASYSTFSHGNNYKMTILDNGITRYRSDHALVYIKGIPEFYSTDHNPYLCWKGSGYTFTSVKEEIISGNRIYSGSLKKGKIELQTAWWFTNTNHITISQLDWRWRVLKGEPAFQLINVTSDTKEGVKAVVREWIGCNKKSAMEEKSYARLTRTEQPVNQ